VYGELEKLQDASICRKIERNIWLQFAQATVHGRQQLPHLYAMTQRDMAAYLEGIAAMRKLERS